MLSQEHINSIVLRFKELEWAWLNSLPWEAKVALGRSHINGEFDPTLLTHYGELFLTLCGIKPCFLIANTDYPQFAQDLVDNVLGPFLPKLHGFEIFRSPQSTSSPTNRGQVVIYVFTSRQHPKFQLIRDIMLNPHPHGKIPNELLGKALGYPVPGGECTFSYVDETTSKELGVSSVVVFEYPARAGFERNVKMHFERCASEFAKLGKVLSIVCQQ